MPHIHSNDAGPAISRWRRGRPPVPAASHGKAPDRLKPGRENATCVSSAPVEVRPGRRIARGDGVVEYLVLVGRTGDAAHSPLGICIRNAEEGGSYAWGPGNGGGAYQFLLGTWETYGGAASEFGVAGPAYQDQIFDNAIAAGAASSWTNYDGC